MVLDQPEEVTQARLAHRVHVVIADEFAARLLVVGARLDLVFELRYIGGAEAVAIGEELDVIHALPFVARNRLRDRGEVKQRNAANREQRGGLARKPGAQLARGIEDRVHAAADLAGSRHGEAAGQNAPPSGREALCDFDEHLRVTLAIAEREDAGVVADALGEARQFALQPPCDRMEPEDGLVHSRQQHGQAIAPADVRALVRQHRLELRFTPGSPRRR